MKMTTSDDAQSMEKALWCLWMRAGLRRSIEVWVCDGCECSLDGRGIDISRCRVNCRITSLIEFPVAWSRSRPHFGPTPSLMGLSIRVLDQNIVHSEVRVTGYSFFQVRDDRLSPLRDSLIGVDSQLES